ncbi:MAG TPA: dUTP diphosphatase [Solirubrobacteraceae bacterium]|nr:dUTP diphosphatase [Solirubrobacteraceae bacterium]
MSEPPRPGPPMLAVRRLDPRARLPQRAHPGDAGLDLCALEPVELAPGARAAVRTGLALEIPEGRAGLVLPRSGLARRHGISLVNAPGLIDAGYRGELEVLLINTDTREPVRLQAGERVAQLVLVDVGLDEVVEVDALSVTARGAGGFGSSGRH